MYPVLILPEKGAEDYLLPSDEIKDFAKINGEIISSLEELPSLILKDPPE
jgi:hypothetical protein